METLKNIQFCKQNWPFPSKLRSKSTLQPLFLGVWRSGVLLPRVTTTDFLPHSVVFIQKKSWGPISHSFLIFKPPFFDGKNLKMTQKSLYRAEKVEIWKSGVHKRRYRWRWHPTFLSALVIRPETWGTEFVQQQFVGLFQPRGTKTKTESPHNQCSASF